MSGGFGSRVQGCCWAASGSAPATAPPRPPPAARRLRLGRPLDCAAPHPSPPTNQLAAAIDNRAGEVGLAILDAARGELLLAQHVETSRGFARTL